MAGINDCVLPDDYIIKMLPKRTYKIKLTIKNVKKGELKIVEDLEGEIE